jgi:hydroxyethylthiazole kinase-like uncharacterized protein yjeF
MLARTAEGALMRRASAALAVSCARVLRRSGTGKVTGRRVVALVGVGNNGGDALFAGARLAGRGAAVTAVRLGSRAHAAGSAALLAAGGRILDAADVEGATTALGRADLVIDGLVGLGARPGLTEPAAGLVRAIGSGARVVAVDLPSGIDPEFGELPESGELPGAYVRADVTVTFGAGKPGLLLPPASAAAGSVELVDLWFGAHLPATTFVERLGRADVAALWPVPTAGSDKYRRGVLGVVAGSAQYPGAAVLAVSGALRTGVGMVRYVGPRDAASAVRAAWPEVVAGTGRVQAWLLGSGVSPDADDQYAAIAAALAGDEPCLLDAGALPVFVRYLAQERDARVAPADVPDRSQRLLLTPHAGELARLLTDLGDPEADPVQRAAVEQRPYRHAHRAAELTGATVLLKGATTVVVRPGGRARSQAEAPPELATAGAGDVLAGIAGALLATGLAPFDAGAVAALVHGLAARAASNGAPITASDIPPHIPSTVNGLLSGGEQR